MKTYTLDLTAEEIEVLFTLAQAGARSFQGAQFDAASQSYLTLRQKALEAMKPENVVPMKDVSHG